MDNQMTGHEAPCRKKQLWGFFAIMILPGSAAKTLITLDAIHTLLVTFASARQECLPSLIMQALPVY